MTLCPTSQSISTVDLIRDVKFNIKMSCSICNDDFDTTTRVPKVLTCGHSICLACLQRLLDSIQISYSGNGEVYTMLACPLCRTSMEIPARKAEGFPTNFQLMEAIVPQDSRILECPSCKLNGSESSFHICRECTIRDHEFDIQDILNEEPPLHPDTYTICSTCVLKEHNSPGHTVIEYVPIRLDYQFKKNKRSVDVLRTQMNEKFGEVLTILTTMPQLVAKKEAEVQKIVDFMERAKNRQNLDMIFDKYKREMNEIIQILDKLRDNGGRLNELVDQKLRTLEKANAEIDKQHCYPEKTDLRKVLKLTSEDVVELPEYVGESSRILKIVEKFQMTFGMILTDLKVSKIFDDENGRRQVLLFLSFVVFFGIFQKLL